MARPWRIQYPNAVYHVMSRGVNRGKLFYTQSDYQRFIACLQRVSEKFNLNIFAFVLMGNHYHILLRTPEGNLSRAMQWLQAAYSAYFNHKNRRSGHLFQGRYKAMLVEDESYWAGLSYYIHCNPIRARMVTDLAKYQWSSYQAYINKIKYPWLDQEEILRRFGRNQREQIRNYRQTLSEISGKEKNILEDLKFGFILGGQEFVGWLQKKFGKKKPATEIPQQKRVWDNGAAGRVINEVQRRFRIKEREELLRPVRRWRNDARDISIYLLHRHTSIGNNKIGSLFRVSSTAVCKASERMGQRIKKEKRLRKNADKLLNSLFNRLTEN